MNVRNLLNLMYKTVCNFKMIFIAVSCVSCLSSAPLTIAYKNWDDEFVVTFQHHDLIYKYFQNGFYEDYNRAMV